MPYIKICFYRPVLLQGGASFSDILEKVEGLPAASRIEQGGTNRSAILNVKKVPGSYVGVASKIRMSELPEEVNTTTGKTNALTLAADDGIGDEVHFAYDGALNVIAIQSNRYFRAGGLRSFLQVLTGTEIEFHRILREDAWGRFDRADLVKKVRIKLARPQQVGKLAPSLSRIMDDLGEFDGVTAELTISAGRGRKDSLFKKVVRDTVRSALKLGKELEALEVTTRVGTDDEDENEEIAFVDWVLEHYEEVGLSGRQLDSDDCSKAVRRALSLHKGYLKTYTL